MSSIDNDVRAIALQIFESLNTPRALAAYLLLKHNELEQLINKDCRPNEYPWDPEGARQYKADYQAFALLKKNESIQIDGIDPRSACIQTFLRCEHECMITNCGLKNLEMNAIWAYDGLASPSDLMEFIYTLGVAKKFARRILGRLPDFPQGDFGPGTSFESKIIKECRELLIYRRSEICLTNPTKKPKKKGDNSKRKIVPDIQPPFNIDHAITAYDKIAYGWGSTQPWGDITECFLTNTPYFHIAKKAHVDNDSRLYRGNRFGTVPKTAKTDRPICVEPGLNLFCQKALGKTLRNRLSSFGLDLDNNQVVHRHLAKVGSRSGAYATIDLSSASDTVSRELVRMLLPKEWYEALSYWRSPMTLVDDKWLHNQKFSSMGNGYTFELETLIFACLVAACGGQLGEDSFVFGDDIIVPTELASKVIATLQIAGFSLNKEKTFVSGPFRESCGGDFFLGIDVRPYFWKKAPKNPSDWISIHNGILDRIGPIRALRAVTNMIPKNDRLYGPPHLGDLVLHGSRESWIVRSFECQLSIKVLSPIPVFVRRSRYKGEVQLASALGGYRSTLQPRDEVAGYAHKWIPLLG